MKINIKLTKSSLVFDHYLKIKPGMDKITSRLETRRYSAIMGATTEFSKLEGLEFDSQTRTLFLSISVVEKRAMLGTTYAAKSIRGFVMGKMTQALDPNSYLPAYTGNLEKIPLILMG
jgi:hypothetical protein